MADDQNPQLPLDGANPPGGTNLIPINIEEEMRRSYLDYSMSVIIGRALPDARDGLKPVHRRILTAMDREGMQHNKKYSKCAGVVGECLKKYHPHGDSSVYDALVRMAQPWSLRYPLVDGQGNFGSVDGDPPAAYRYTECRMERIAEEMMADIEMETVDMVPNFDETTDEPSVLPTRIPTLIVNGSNGIAVGMATNIPPHNLTEVLNATIALVKNPKAGLAEVLKHVQGPDFPTAGILYGRTGNRGCLSHRPRALPDARAGGHRERDQGSEGADRHRAALPGEQIDALQAHRRAGGEQGHLRHRHQHRTHARRERPRRHEDGDRPEARRAAGDCAEPALQAHATAGELLHDLPGRGQRPAARAGPRRGHPAFSSTTASTWCSGARSSCCARRANASTFWKA